MENPLQKKKKKIEIQGKKQKTSQFSKEHNYCAWKEEKEKILLRKPNVIFSNFFIRCLAQQIDDECYSMFEWFEMFSLQSMERKKSEAICDKYQLCANILFKSVSSQLSSNDFKLFGNEVAEEEEERESKWDASSIQD